MSLYCKNQSALRPYILGISGVVGTIGVSVFAHKTDWSLSWWYVPIGLFVWLVFGLLLYKIFDPVNRWLIRTVGAKQLEKEQRALALEIVRVLFDREQSIDFPEEDDDLVKREAAISFGKFFWSNEYRGSKES